MQCRVHFIFAACSIDIFSIMLLFGVELDSIKDLLESTAKSESKSKSGKQDLSSDSSSLHIAVHTAGSERVVFGWPRSQIPKWLLLHRLHQTSLNSGEGITSPSGLALYSDRLQFLIVATRKVRFRFWWMSPFTMISCGVHAFIISIDTRVIIMSGDDERQGDRLEDCVEFTRCAGWQVRRHRLCALSQLLITVKKDGAQRKISLFTL